MSEIVKGTVVLLVGFFNLVLGVLVLSRNPKKSINQSFFVICFSFFVWCFALHFYEHPLYFSSLFWVRLVYLAAVIYMSTTLLFSFVFPSVSFKVALVYAKIYMFLYVLFSVWLLYFTKWWVIGVVIDPVKGLQTILHTQGYIVWILATWVNFLWIAINFIIKGKTASRYQKQQLSYLWIGYILFGIAVTISDGVIPLAWHDTSYFYLSAVTNLFFSGLVGYIILKHRFLDIKLVLARSVSFTILLIILGLLYVVAFFGVGNLFASGTSSLSSQEAVLVYTLLSLVIAFTLGPLRVFLESTTDKIFYKGRYNSQDLLHSFSQTIATTPTFSNLTYRLLEVIEKEMRISKVFFAIMRNENLYLAESEHQENGLNISSTDVERLQSESSAILIDEIPDGITRTLMEKNGISLIVPLRTRENYVGLLLLGEKKSGEMYFNMDIDVLEIAGPEFAVALQNAERFEEINQFNITLQEEVKVATAELRDANKRLTKLDELKDEFISIASHDLRAPLANTKGYVWLAVNDIADLSPKAKEHLSKALESTERSISLVNDMLDVSRIEAGRMELNIAKFNVGKLIESVKEELEVPAKDKKVVINVCCNEDVVVMADENKVHQVLGNLVGNAIKFTKNGGLVTISLKDLEKAVEISVADTGVGVKADDIGKLFTKFGRIGNETSSVPVITGTGLGLYICKSIVELFGGKIWVTSEVGKGSIFTFTIPKA